MGLFQKIQKLANQNNGACVSISFNTHRTHPENQQDAIVLKNLVKDATARVEAEYDHREVADLLSKLSGIEEKIDHNHNLESMHIFLSNDTEEVIKTTWSARENISAVDESFAIRPLIKAYGRSQEYLILVLAQDGTHLYSALNDTVLGEVHNHVFPFKGNSNSPSNNTQKSDSEYMDNILKEHYRDIDKALVDYIRDTNQDLGVVVISTADNYSKLQAVATQPKIYVGHDDKDYHATSEQQLAEQAWEIIKELQKNVRTEAISEIKEAVAKSLVLTDLQEIYEAAVDGRGDLLIVNHNYEQPVRLTGDRTFEYVQDAKEPGALDDVVSQIAWEVLSKKGRVYFTEQEQLDELGQIVLKTRY